MLIGRVCHMFMCCRQIRDARHDARSVPAAGCVNFVAGDVLLFRLDADAVCRLYCRFVELVARDLHWEMLNYDIFFCAL